MSPNLRSVVTAALPLGVERASWTDEVLTLAGEGWSLAVNCSWRLVSRGRLLVGWDGSGAADEIARLVGLTVVGIEPQSPALPADPSLALSNGVVLEVFSSHQLEPWVLTLPAITVVASPSDPLWIEQMFGE